MRRAAMSGGLLLVAILIQLTVLNNLRLPGGAGAGPGPGAWWSRSR